jgi:hypothetical protein
MNPLPPPNRSCTATPESPNARLNPASRLTLSALALSLATMCGVAAANDFPTIERVLFVENCVRDHPDRQRQEMLYKCSCAVDAIAAEIPYEQYVELSTAFDAGQVAGERGAAVRESNAGQDMSKGFKAVRAKAFSSCFIQ